MRAIHLMIALFGLFFLLGCGSQRADAPPGWVAASALPSRDSRENELIPEFNTEAYASVAESGFKQADRAPLSTFSVDVDTASYSNVRRFLRNDSLPPQGAVRIEELINYFAYDYAPPTDGRPFAVHTEVADCPWKEGHQLVRVGIKGQVITSEERPVANLVFLIDVSGSMEDANKLPLVKRSLQRLAKELQDDDRVAIVTYAGSAGVHLQSTPASQQRTIQSSIEELRSGGSTNGASGIQMAYKVARQEFLKEGVNRVILCTDGDFNVGITSESELVKLIQQEAKSGVFLSVLGFGMGNYQDSRVEKLADFGNGNYAYIDSDAEARKVLIEQLSGTLVTIAKDVKIQIEFNPERVGAYRLIGYDNRRLENEDFRNDEKDAGEIGAGHTVTAIYELVPPGIHLSETEVPKLKYQEAGVPSPAARSNELLTVRLRYQRPEGGPAEEFTRSVTEEEKPFAEASEDFRFASAVAAFGMLLGGSQHAGEADWADVKNWGKNALGTDSNDYRLEFLELVSIAKRLSPTQLSSR